MDTDKIPEIEMLRKAIDPGSAQFFSAQAFHKADEPRRLGSQSFLNVRTGEATGFIQELVDSGHEDALGKNVGIAVAEEMACNCSTGRSAPQIPADKPTKHTGRRSGFPGTAAYR